MAAHALKEKVLAELDLEHRPKVKRKALLISPALLALCKYVPVCVYLIDATRVCTQTVLAHTGP